MRLGCWKQQPRPRQSDQNRMCSKHQRPGYQNASHPYEAQMDLQALTQHPHRVNLTLDIATGKAAPGDVSNAGAGTQPLQRPDGESGIGRPQGVPGRHQAAALREFWRRGSTGRDSRAQWRHPESRRGGASPAQPGRVSTHDQASL